MENSNIDYRWFISTIIAIIAIFAAINNQSCIRNCFGSTSIDFTKVVPYRLAGNNMGYQDVFIDTFEILYTDTNEYYKACDVRTYFKNSMASVYRISDMSINIKEITPILHADIDISAILIDKCIYVYAINQGLADVNDIEINLRATYYEDYDQPIYIYMNQYFDFNDCASTISIDCIHGGEIIELFSFDINDEGIRLLEQNIWLSLEANMVSKEISQDASRYMSLGFLVYESVEGKVHLTKQEGEDDISATFFAFVNVNNGNGEYSIPMRINPNIENDFNVGVDTVIIPNQSCYIKFSIVYKIGDKTLETETISTKIFVPLYKDDCGFYDSLLIYCVENQIRNYRKDTQPYIENALKYDVYSILDEINYINSN